MKTVFLLQHSYQYDIGDSEMVDETKVLGVFSTKDEGVKAIEYYKTLSGFKDYPIECFDLEEHTLDEKQWKEGFFTA